MMTFAVFYQGLLLFIFFRQENLFICTAPKQDSEEDTHSHYGSQLQIFIQVYQDPSLRNSILLIPFITFSVKPTGMSISSSEWRWSR